MLRKSPQHDIETPPGQIKTLGDYIISVEKSEERLLKKKLTFEEWLNQQQTLSGYEDPWQCSYYAAEDAWNASRENM